MDTHSPTEICFGTCACIEDEDEDVHFLPMQSHPTRFASQQICFTSLSLIF
ncbi:unnamed protein product [Musa acuminata subsp. burmannicoides]